MLAGKDWKDFQSCLVENLPTKFASIGVTSEKKVSGAVVQKNVPHNKKFNALYNLLTTLVFRANLRFFANRQSQQRTILVLNSNKNPKSGID
jgi:hypothetical protein